MKRSIAAVLGALTAIAGAVGALAAFSSIRARRVERLVPAAGAFLDVAGSRLHYIERGNGPAIVMIHGLAGQSGNFTHSLVDRLSDEFRVIALDRPGSGYSSRPRGAPANVRHQADVIAAFIAELQIDRPFVVGHSLGGAIALALALDHPGLVCGIALIAPYTHARGGVPEPFAGLAIRSPWLREALARTIAVPISMQRRRAILAAIFRPDVPPANFDTAGGGLLSTRPRAFVAASEDLLASARDLRELTKRYASLAVPASVLYGTNDNVLDHEVHGTSMHEKNPSIDVTLVPGGHMLPLTAANETAAWIRTRARAARSGVS